MIPVAVDITVVVTVTHVITGTVTVIHVIVIRCQFEWSSGGGCTSVLCFFRMSSSSLGGLKPGPG